MGIDSVKSGMGRTLDGSKIFILFEITHQGKRCVLEQQEHRYEMHKTLLEILRPSLEELWYTMEEKHSAKFGRIRLSREEFFEALREVKGLHVATNRKWDYFR